MQKVKAIDNYCSDKGISAFKVGNDEPAIFPDAKPFLLLEVTDVKKTYKQLLQQGIVFTKTPYRIQTGWAAELQDPAGNIIGITDYNN